MLVENLFGEAFRRSRLCLVTIGRDKRLGIEETHALHGPVVLHEGKALEPCGRSSGVDLLVDVASRRFVPRV